MDFSRLYAIVDVDLADGYGWSPTDLGAAIIKGGGRLLQIRAKRSSSESFLACADSLVDLARPSNTSIIVNDRVDVAKLSGASGVHVGQDDLSVSRTRRILGNDAVIGLSTHCRSQVDLAVQESVAYIAVGPVFATRSKETGYQPVGLELVRYAARQWPQSIIVGIGGITLERAPSVIEAGANAVAVISDLLTDGDPERRTRAYLERLYQ